MLLSLSSVAFAGSKPVEEETETSLLGSYVNFLRDLTRSNIETAGSIANALTKSTSETFGDISGYFADKVEEIGETVDKLNPISDMLPVDASDVAGAVADAISGGTSVFSSMLQKGTEIAQAMITRSMDLIDRVSPDDGQDDPAPEAEELKYVALGDSTAMGFYVGNEPEFTFSYKHNVGSENKAPSSEYSEFAMFSKYLQEVTGKTVKKDGDLTMPGMRPVLLRGILDETFYNTEMAKETTRYNDHFKSHMTAFSGGEYSLYKNAYNKKDGKEFKYDGYQQLHDDFTRLIKEADVITYDTLMVDFSLYMLAEVLPGVLYSKESCNAFQTLLNEEGYSSIAGSAASLESTLKSVLNKAGLTDTTMIHNLLDVFMYTYAQFAINFSKNMDDIYRLNPDVTLIVLGPTNPFDGVTATVGGVKLDLGKIWGYITDAITAYLVMGDPHADDYYFADCASVNGADEICMKAFADGRLFTDADYSQALTYFSQSYEALSTSTYLQNMIKTSCQSFYDNGLDITAVLNGDYSGLSSSAIALGMMMALNGIGFHPTDTAYLAKEAAIEAAFQRGYAANGTYLARAIETSEYLTANAIGAIWNIGDSRNNLKTFFTDLFTPAIDLSALIGGLMKK